MFRAVRSKCPCFSHETGSLSDNCDSLVSSILPMSGQARNGFHDPMRPGNRGISPFLSEEGGPTLWSSSIPRKYSCVALQVPAC